MLQHGGTISALIDQIGLLKAFFYIPPIQDGRLFIGEIPLGMYFRGLRF
jgi:hypothetical protein